MKRFDFPLEKVRLWRREQAELEGIKLQKLCGDLAAIDGLRRQHEADLDEAGAAVLQDARELEQLDGFRQFKRGQIRQTLERAGKCEREITQQRALLIEARRQSELLDRLKQKAMAEWRAARDKEEEELAGELFLAKRRRETKQAL